MNPADPISTTISSPEPPSNGLPSIDAGEGDRDPIALLGLGSLGLGAERTILLGDLLHRLVDLGVGHLGDQLLELDALEIGKLDLRQDFDGDRVGEIGLAGDHVLHFRLFGGQRHLGLGGELETAVGHDLGVGVAHGRFDRLGHGAAPIEPLEVGDRDLARTEAVDADLVLELLEPRVDLAFQFRRRNHDLVFALEALGEGFRHLHWFVFRRRRRAGAWLKFKVRAVRARRGAGGGTRTPTTFVTGT